jgi:hypothetical protein
MHMQNEAAGGGMKQDDEATGGRRPLRFSFLKQCAAMPLIFASFGLLLLAVAAEEGDDDVADACYEASWRLAEATIGWLAR